MSMSVRRRPLSAVGSRLVRTALVVGCVVPALLAGGVATASAATNPCTSAPRPVASIPTNPVRRERHDLRPVDVGRFDQRGAQRRAAGG